MGCNCGGSGPAKTLGAISRETKTLQVPMEKPQAKPQAVRVPMRRAKQS